MASGEAHTNEQYKQEESGGSWGLLNEPHLARVSCNVLKCDHLRRQGCIAILAQLQGMQSTQIHQCTSSNGSCVSEQGFALLRSAEKGSRQSRLERLELGIRGGMRAIWVYNSRNSVHTSANRNELSPSDTWILLCRGRTRRLDNSRNRSNSVYASLRTCFARASR